MSLISFLFGMPHEVFCEMRKPYADRPDKQGRRAVENFDIATLLLRMEGDVSGTIQVNRCAWGRKGRLQLQIFGSGGAIAFDQERFNEVGVYLADGPAADQGFRTVLMGPAHPPYAQFVVAPGHQMGFNDLKIVEAHELLNRIAGKPSMTIDFDAGLAIEKVIHAAARSGAEGRWAKAR
jgi:predicted dehydrogenase